MAILKQAGISGTELRLATQYCYVTNTPCHSARIEDLGREDLLVALARGPMTPVGSVEFIRKILSLIGVVEPTNITYPEALQPFLHREVRCLAKRDIPEGVFVKPQTTKAFTGFVLTAPGEWYDEHDIEQFEAFSALPDDTLLWASERVSWLSEFRYYVCNGEIKGYGRYDDGPDDVPEPELDVIRQMVAQMEQDAARPVAYAIDAGVLSTGQTALVECNDAWALGFYKGTLDYKEYFWLLRQRWAEMRKGPRLH